jgi:hypothetical protein
MMDGARKVGHILARPGVTYETCGHEAATLRNYGAGGFMLVCDPCDAESEASLSLCASSVCGDCDEDLMGGGPHAAGCPCDVGAL